MGLYAQIGYPTEKIPLSDEEYVRALGAFIKYCHDVVPVGPDGKFYLPTRRVDNPHLTGIWFVGGAQTPFMSDIDSLIKLVTRELGIHFRADRFVPVCHNSYLFSEATGATPHHAECEVYVLRLTAEEIAKVHLDPKEYEQGSLRPFGLEEIENIPDEFVRNIFLDLWYKIHNPVLR